MANEGEAFVTHVDRHLRDSEAFEHAAVSKLATALTAVAQHTGVP
jgi:hypothetical protein